MAEPLFAAGYDGIVSASEYKQTPSELLNYQRHCEQCLLLNFALAEKYGEASIIARTPLELMRALKHEAESLGFSSEVIQDVIHRRCYHRLGSHHSWFQEWKAGVIQAEIRFTKADCLMFLPFLSLRPRIPDSVKLALLSTLPSTNSSLRQIYQLLSSTLQQDFFRMPESLFFANNFDFNVNELYLPGQPGWLLSASDNIAAILKLSLSLRSVATSSKGIVKPFRKFIESEFPEIAFKLRQKLGHEHWYVWGIHQAIDQVIEPYFVDPNQWIGANKRLPKFFLKKQQEFNLVCYLACELTVSLPTAVQVARINSNQN
jgi:hypothetical protein